MTRKNNLNTIHALRSRGSIDEMMAVGALYVLGHADLASRAESAFPALQSLNLGLAELNAALERDYPVIEAMLTGGAAAEIEASIPPERTAEIEQVTAWRDAEAASVAKICAEIDRIIDGLYDTATIIAEEGGCL